MASGLGVVAFDCAGAKWLIENGRTGLTVEPGDHRSFADQAERLATDRPLLARIRQGAREASLQSSWSSIVTKAEEIMFSSASARQP
jgi:glycosyltransferase involved in cell wall biosynthesis